MTKYKLQIRLVAITLALVFSNVALAAELSNEYKNIRASNTISDADLASHAHSDTSFTVDASANTSISHQQQFNSYTETIKQMKERRRLLQENQLEAYKLYMQSKKQHSSANNNLPPDDVQARREKYIEQMKQRQELMNKMMNERRTAAQERRQIRLQKMHQTSTTSATADES